MKRFTAVLAVVLGAAMLIGATAVAEEGAGDKGVRRQGPPRGRHGQGREVLKEIDANGDKQVTRGEFMAWHVMKAEERFTKMDSNGDGVLTEEDRPARPPRPAGEGRGGPRRRGPRARRSSSIRAGRIRRRTRG